MTRKIQWFTLCFAIGIVFGILSCKLQIGLHYLWICPAVFAACFLFGREKLKHVSVLLSAFVIGTIFLNLYTSIFIAPVSALAEKTYESEVTVQAYPQLYEDSVRAKVSVCCDKVPHAFSTYVYFPLECSGIKPGDTIQCSIQFYQPTVYDGFDRASYYNGQGIYILGSCSELSQVRINSPEHIPLRAYPAVAAEKMKQILLSSGEDQTSGFLISLLLGDKSHLDDLVYDNMQKSGIAHVVSVSGMHVSFIVGFLILILGKRNGAIAAAIVAVFFMLMAGATPSVMRATIMYLIFAAGFLLRREPNSINSLAIALLVILCSNPYAILNISLQLSFTATLGIVLFSSRIQRKMRFTSRYTLLRKLLAFIKGTIACSIASMVFTTPILLYNFGYISLVAPFTNLLVLWMVSAVFLLGFVSCFLSFLPGIHSFFIWLLSKMVDYIVSISNHLAGLPFSVLLTNQTFHLAAVIIVYAVVILALIFAKKWKKSLVVSIVCSTFAVLMVLGVYENSHTGILSYLSCGTGQTMMVSPSRQRLAVIDCGASGHRNSAELSTEWMNLYGRHRIDALVLTGIDKTHAKYATELIEQTEIDSIILPETAYSKELEEDILCAAQKHHISIRRVAPGKEDTLLAADFGITINGDVEKKLIVQVHTAEQDILILHSLTQKMLQSYLQNHTLQGDLLVLNSNNLKDYDLLQEALHEIAPQEIFLASGYFGSPTELNGISVKNTYECGNIHILYETR